VDVGRMWLSMLLSAFTMLSGCKAVSSGACVERMYSRRVRMLTVRSSCNVRTVRRRWGSLDEVVMLNVDVVYLLDSCLRRCSLGLTA
jgi:hypothetical protein